MFLNIFLLDTQDEMHDVHEFRIVLKNLTHIDPDGAVGGLFGSMFTNHVEFISIDGPVIDKLVDR
jgi:hypothetical protein